MATDIKKIIKNLLEFYDFTDKTIITVGAGGGQLVDYGYTSKKVFAIDQDEKALKALSENLVKKELDTKFTLIHSDFLKTSLKADVVMFEFCLHEMRDVEEAIRHAQTMAPDILISDHWPGSEWAHIVDETEKVNRSWKEIEKFPVRKIVRYDAVQYFKNYQEIYQKVAVQGINSIERIKNFKDSLDINIPMLYGFALI
jgi:predicted RNA methylase